MGNVTHVWGVKGAKYFTEQKIKKVRGVKGVLYSAYTSWSEEVALLSFLDLSKWQGWLQARHTANSKFLKLRAVSNPGFLHIYENKAASSSIP